MELKIRHNNCPLCNSSKISEATEAVDHTVSNEAYEIWQCNDCSFRFTQDAPSKDSIGEYYKSTDYISHSNNNKGIINRLYHVVRNRTLITKQKLVEQVTEKRNGTILDVGAGTGFFAATMKRAGWSVTALEPDETARVNAVTHNHIQLMPLEQLFNLPLKSFDCITLWHVLEHVHDLHDYMEQFHKLLKQGGKLLIAVPNYTSYDCEHYNSNWAAYDVPRHLWHFSPTSMKQLSTQHSFNISSLQPMWYDSYYVSMLSEKYKGGNILGALLTGFKSNQRAKKDVSRCSSIIYCMNKV